MSTTLPPPEPTARLVRILQSRRADILRAHDALIAELPSLAALPQVAREDHLPRMLDHLIELVADTARPPDQGAIRAAHDHTVERLQQGVDLETLTREYALLRRAILRVLSEVEPSRHGDTIVRLDAALDAAVRDAVLTWTTMRQRLLQSADRIHRLGLTGGLQDDLLGHLVRVLFEATQVDEATILLREEDLLVVRATVGLERELEQRFSTRIGEGFAGTIAVTRQPLELQDTAAHPLVTSEVLRRAKLQALFGVPLLFGDELVGVAHIGTRRADRFSDEDKLLFQEVATRATLVIAQTLARAREKVAGAAARAFASADDPDAAVVAFMAELGPYFGWDVGVFWRMRGDELRPARFWTRSEALDGYVAAVRGVRCPVGEGLAGRAWERGSAEWAPGFSADLCPPCLEAAQAAGLRNGIAFALRSGTRSLGVLEFLGHTHRESTASPIRMTTQAANQLDAFLRRLEATERLRASEARAAESEKLQRLLAEASRRLAEPTDREVLLATLGAVAVPEWADQVWVDLVRDGQLTCVVARPATHRLGRPLSAGSAPARVARTGRSELVERATDDNRWQLQPPDGDGAAVVSWVVVPLTARNRTLGVLSLGRREERAAFRPADLVVAEDLARRAATALDNLRLYEETRRSALQLQALLQRLPAGLIVSEDHRLDIVSDRAVALLGGRPTWDTLPKGLADALASREVLQGVEIPVDTPHGARVLLVEAAPIQEAGAAPVASLVAFVDLTERKLAERDLERAAAFRDDLLGIVSHDLRNPLMAINIATTLLLRQGQATPAQERLLRRVSTSAERMARMITELLDLTRGRLGQGIPVDLAPVDMGVLVRHAVEENEVAHPGRVLRATITGDVTGLWDAERLSQVLSNLIGNALTYGDADRPVDVRVEGADHTVVVEVRNEGEPIPPDQLARLFDAARRAVRTERSRPAGLGLGLYIVNLIVQAHRGTVTARSTTEETVFRVVLPKQPPQPT